MIATTPVEIELHNSSSRARKRCRWRWQKNYVEGWQPRRIQKALYLGTAIDLALKAYYYEGSRQQTYDNLPEGVRQTWPAPGEAPFRDLDAAELAASTAMEEFFEKALQLPTEDEEARQVTIELARGMWTMYTASRRDMPDEFEVLCVGRQFQGLIHAYQGPLAQGSTIPFYYAGEFDGIILMNGVVYLLENKTSSQVANLINSLERDEQASRYHLAVSKMVAAGALEYLGIHRDTPVWGTLFNIIWKRAPANGPRINKPLRNVGTLISKQSVNCHVNDYVAAVAEHRPYVWELPTPPTGRGRIKPTYVVLEAVDLGPYGIIAPMLEAPNEALETEWKEQHVPELLRLRDLPWVRRVEVDRNQYTLALVQNQLIVEMEEELDLRLNPYKIYRNPTFECARDCSFMEPCNADLQGQPIQSMLEEFFVRKGEEQQAPVLLELIENDNFDMDDLGAEF